MTTLGVGDLDGDRRPEIVAAGSIEAKAWTPSGREVARIDLTATPTQLMVEDLNADGRAEIVLTSEDGRIECYAADGLRLFSKRAMSPVKTVGVDLDGDGSREFFGTTLGQGLAAFGLDGAQKNSARMKRPVSRAIVPRDLDRDGQRRAGRRDPGPRRAEWSSSTENLAARRFRG